MQRCQHLAVLLIVHALVLSTGRDIRAQCRLDVTSLSAPIGVSGDPKLRNVHAADGGLLLTEGDESALILKWNGAAWEVEQELFPEDPSIVHGTFSYVGALRGNVAVVGTPYVSCDAGDACGAVFVYELDGTSWAPIATLTNPEAQAEDRFGRALAFNGNVIAVRTDGILWQGERMSGFWTFRQVGGVWTRDALPIANVFGRLADAGEVEVAGDTLVVGMSQEECNDGDKCGAVWVYQYTTSTGWSNTAVLANPEAQALDYFGTSLALDGTSLMIGATGRDCAVGDDCGAVFVYNHDGDSWTLRSVLEASDTTAGDRFGRTLAVREGYLLVGSESGRGAVYVYHFDGSAWSLTAKFNAIGLPSTGMNFGSSVELTGQLAVISASGAGRGHSYAITGNDCNGNGALDACDGAGLASAVEQFPLCECATLAGPTTTAYATGRFLSISGGNPGRRTAIRITALELPAPHETAVGRSMWVGRPSEVSELSGVVDPAAAPGTPAFLAAEPACEPVYADRGASDVVHVYGPAIIPGGYYSVQLIDGGCPLAQEDSYTPPIAFPTANWGDTVEDCADVPCAAPEGVVRVVDAIAIINKFNNAPTAIAKVRADLEPATPDLIVNVSDALYSLRAFSGSPYPFALPAPCE